MKKIFSLLLTFAMIFSMSATAFAADFTDVDETHVNYEAIETLETLNIINGYPGDKMGPEDTLTRAQAATMLTRALYANDIHYGEANIFSDVAVNHWAKANIDTAYRYGLMKGYGNGVFGPEDNLSYTQMARMILNALGYGSFEWPVGVNTVAYELGLYDNIAVKDMEASITRAHTAQMIYNAFDCRFVNEYAGEHFETNKTFLLNGLGYEETVEYVDGHIYVAYDNVTDKSNELYVTDIRSTTEQTIYPRDNGYKYALSTSNRAKTYDINWYWENGNVTVEEGEVVLYVNGVRIHEGSEIWFAGCESATGTFDTNDNLVAIYVENKGVDYTPNSGAFVIGQDNVAIADAIENKIESNRNFDERTSTVTYFVEDDSYVISNEIICGFVTSANRTSVWIDNVKYTLGVNHGLVEGDFVVLYLNYRGEIAGREVIGEPYHFNVKSMTYHTWECYHYNDRANEANWCHGKDAVVSYFESNVNVAGTDIKFDACKDCHAEGKWVISIPEIVTIPEDVTGIVTLIERDAETDAITTLTVNGVIYTVAEGYTHTNESGSSFVEGVTVTLSFNANNEIVHFTF